MTIVLSLIVTPVYLLAIKIHSVFDKHEQDCRGTSKRLLILILRAYTSISDTVDRVSATGISICPPRRSKWRTNTIVRVSQSCVSPQPCDQPPFDHLDLTFHQDTSHTLEHLSSTKNYCPLTQCSKQKDFLFKRSCMYGVHAVHECICMLHCTLHVLSSPHRGSFSLPARLLLHPIQQDIFELRQVNDAVSINYDNQGCCVRFRKT
jgi:hypothetical protein